MQYACRLDNVKCLPVVKWLSLVAIRLFPTNIMQLMHHYKRLHSESLCHVLPQVLPFLAFQLPKVWLYIWLYIYIYIYIYTLAFITWTESHPSSQSPLGLINRCGSSSCGSSSSSWFIPREVSSGLDTQVKKETVQPSSSIYYTIGLCLIHTVSTTDHSSSDAVSRHIVLTRTNVIHL